MAAKFRIACLASGQGRLMQTAINCCGALDLPFEIALMIADRSNEAHVRAKRAGIDSVIVDHKNFSDRDSFDAAMLKELHRAKIDGLMLTFDRLLGPTLLTHYPDRILNTHFSLLPRFPGFNPIAKAIAAGMTETGATIHIVDETMDGGPIVGQVKVPMDAGITEATLGTKIFKAVAPLYVQSMVWLASGRLKNTNRNDGTGAYSPPLEPPFDRLPDHFIAMK